MVLLLLALFVLLLLQDFANILWALAVFQQQQQQQAQAAGVSLHSSCSSSSSTRSSHEHPVLAYATTDAGNVSSSLYNSSRCNSTTAQSSSGSSSSMDVESGSSSSSSSPVIKPLLQAWAILTWRYTQPARAGLTPADATQLLWAASQLGRSNKQCWPDRDWLQQFWAVSRRQLSKSTAAGSAAALPELQTGQRQQQQQGGADVFNAQALTLCMWAGLRMCAGPPGGWLVAALPLLQSRLAELQPAAACQLLYVLARQQHRPSPAFMQQLLSRLQLDSHQLEPRAFACVLWSLGRLGFRPGANWWAVVLQHLAAHGGGLGRRELGNVLYGLAMLQLQVPEQLLQALQQRAVQVAQPHHPQQQQQQQQMQQHTAQGVTAAQQADLQVHSSEQQLEAAAQAVVRLPAAATLAASTAASICGSGRLGSRSRAGRTAARAS
jgi:hypothetical protein